MMKASLPKRVRRRRRNFMRKLFLLLVIVLSVGCRPSHRELLDKADEDLINQRALLAKYIYLKISKEHTTKDFIRYRALKGLVDVSLTQLYEYPVAVGAMEMIVNEFEGEPQFRGEMPEWRERLAEVLRINLQQPRKAKEVLQPLLSREDLPERIEQEIGQTLLALNEYTDAEIFFKRAWDKTVSKPECSLARQLQLNLIQTYTLSRRCDLAIEWTEKQLPNPCKPDSLSLLMERANCLEINGEPGQAIKIYEDLLKENPKNLRAQFLIQSIRKREREKVKK